MKKKMVDFFKIVGISLCLFLCVTWVKGAPGNIFNVAWSEEVAYFFLTYWALKRYGSGAGLSIWSVAIAVFLGRILLEIPVRAFDWYASVSTLIFILSSLLAIVLSALCYNKKSEAYLLSIGVMILYNTFVLEAWNLFIRDRCV